MKRRDWIKRTVSLPVVMSGAAAFVVACGGEEKKAALSCTDVSGLSDADKTMRAQQEYSDKSSKPDQSCSNCNFYQAAGQGACGTCQVIKGPIHPAGWCKLWAKKA
ncbi:MAG: high-potential iron-sulfur protein [Myxococcales bacterium]|nr:high-potential iron-sulfur protein [Myxococcales bacterium]